jgi:molybdate-binding protein
LFRPRETPRGIDPLSHLPDRASGDFNVAQARRVLARTGGLVVTYASWEQGFVVPPGNPKGLRGVADLARPEVRLVNRELGSGSRALIDELLAGARVPPSALSGYDRVVTSHLAVARAVGSGAADVGIGLRALAHACGLDFVPLADVRFDLVIPRDHLEHPAVAVLLEVLQSRALRTELAALPGYSVGRMGTALADLPSAA